MPEPEPKLGDLGAFVRQFIEAFEEAFPSLTLEASCPPVAVGATFDPHLLRQVLVNLCRNAAEAGGVGSIVMTCGNNGDGPFVEVSDDGPGVPPELRQRLFEPYVSQKRDGRGLGLGLAISRKILLDLGGDLILVDDAGPGARFRLCLPRPAHKDGELELGEMPAEPTTLR
jgi:signal transduction histidine kinase